MAHAEAFSGVGTKRASGEIVGGQRVVAHVGRLLGLILGLAQSKSRVNHFLELSNPAEQLAPPYPREDVRAYHERGQRPKDPERLRDVVLGTLAVLSKKGRECYRPHLRGGVSEVLGQ